MSYHIDRQLNDDDKARVKAGFALYAQAHIGASRLTHDWVMRDDTGKCIGHIQLIEVGQEGYIKLLWVDEQHRGLGYASKLVSLVEDYATKAEYNCLWVDTYAYQAPEFYQKCGFVKICEVPAYQAGHARIFFKKEYVS